MAESLFGKFIRSKIVFLIIYNLLKSFQSYMEKKKMERDGPLNSYYSRVKSPLTDPAQARVRNIFINFSLESNFDIYKYY